MILPKVLYVMGMPGAGKGTQAEMIAETVGYMQFSTGNAFRTISRQDTDLGRRVKETIDNGFLAPPEMAAEVVIAAVQEFVSHDTGLVFDGTPRTVRESEIVDQFFLDHGYGRPLVLYLEVSKEIMMERSSKRLYCMDIADGFPVLDDKDAALCASRGGRVGRRPDDEPEKFLTRYNEFMKHTYPVVERYRKESILHVIDGSQDRHVVHEAIMGIIGQYDYEKKS
ncbi:MAG: hypothetical protein A3E36_04270 [Candidatus Andersenbacteria bacterium RIFCSPHIGHO2_12_FULL_45_11b]|uniref:Adenylate kinase n=1 Tax=Candidatus Andersenbacteria bacterium RIFCSPHIGHO2_12_FULL_45_11b TaxID=1797282 RepID=A0A1G1X7M8_9BACT|nr:MAG: hypothetical protein A3E36_04270 [Candidatus Andersenbacteria bacterium RIFCSPHIGHO2_12_FULL_45_11b]